MESLGLRLEGMEREDVYALYHPNVYRQARGTRDQLEEALANASSYHRLSIDPCECRISTPIVDATRTKLRAPLSYEFLGYRRAARYLTHAFLEQGEDLRQSRVHEATLLPSQTPSDWSITTRLIQSLSKIMDNMSAAITSGGGRILLGKPWP